MKVMEQAKYRNRASELIRVALVSGIMPWGRSAILGKNVGEPTDQNGRPFNGVARWLLELAAIDRRYRSSIWATLDAWDALGHSPDLDQGVEIILRNGKSPFEPVVVYNREALGLHPEGESKPDYVEAQRILDASGAWVKHGYECKYVRISPAGMPAKDWIIMPTAEEIGGIDLYWTVMFHELVHWMAYGFRRMNWQGDEDQGELIADLGAAILAAHCGIDPSGNLRSAIISRWDWKMLGNSGYFIDAAEFADEATNRILRTF